VEADTELQEQLKQQEHDKEEDIKRRLQEAKQYQCLFFLDGPNYTTYTYRYEIQAKIAKRRKTEDGLTVYHESHCYSGDRKQGH
jgi:hypothetical protein